MKIARFELARGDNKATHVYFCLSAEVADATILPDPQNYNEEMKHPDVSKLTEAIELVLKQLGRLKVLESSTDGDTSDIQEAVCGWKD